MSNPLCLSGDVVASLGDLAQWDYGIASSLAGDKSDPAVVPYNKAMELLADGARAGRVGHRLLGSGPDDGEGDEPLGREPTSAKLTVALRGFKGPQALGAPSFQCGKYPAEPAACNDQTQFFQYQGKGVFKRLTGWLRPPAGFNPERLAASLQLGTGPREVAPPSLSSAYGRAATPPLCASRPRRRIADRRDRARHRPPVPRVGDHQHRDRRDRDGRRLLVLVAEDRYLRLDAPTRRRW